MNYTKYSPIKQIMIRDFRNLGGVTIDFSESPIVSLIGDNESGKTSVVKAFGVCARNIDFRYQKDYIRDGTNEFGVAIILEDGTQLVRKKGRSSGYNRYWIVYPDGRRWDSEKLDTEVPPPVQDIMGLIEEPETKELIHIRTYEDLLLFVVTPASTNYKVMYDALKISQITRAIKAGNNEVNSLKANISKTTTSIGALEKTLSNIRTFDLEPLINIKNKLINDLDILRKFNLATELIQSIDLKKKELGVIELIDEHGLQPIEAMEVDKLNRISSLSEDLNTLQSTLSSYEALQETEPIDINLLSKLNNAVDTYQSLNTMMVKSSAYMELSKVEAISELEVNQLVNIGVISENLYKLTTLNSIYDLSNSNLELINQSDIDIIGKLSRISEGYNIISLNRQELIKMEATIEQAIAWLKSIGVAATSCPKCGESIIIDLDLISEGVRPI